jgi:hypothetical protein
MNNFNKLLHLSTFEKKLLFRVTFTSIWIKAIVLVFPLRWYSKILGIEHTVSPIDPVTNADHIVFKLSQSIIRSRKILPWKSNCLVDAITAKIILNHGGINSTIYFGVTKENGAIKAHAWLRCGTIYVTGKRGMEKFVVVSTFA